MENSNRESPLHHIILLIRTKDRVRIGTLLRKLKIDYREEDANLWEHHGVESIRDFKSMTTYLTHETEQAILDGKHRYDRDELVSNLTPEELEQIRDGYMNINKMTGRDHELKRLKRQIEHLKEENEQLKEKVEAQADEIAVRIAFYDCLDSLFRKFAFHVESYEKEVASIFSEWETIIHEEKE